MPDNGESRPTVAKSSNFEKPAIGLIALDASIKIICYTEFYVKPLPKYFYQTSLFYQELVLDDLHIILKF